MPGPFTHSHRVAYWEVDQQHVVFHGHWLRFFDDAMSRFMDALGFPPGPTFANHFDVMVVKAALEWQSGVGFDEIVDITVVPTRLGTASFDLAYEATTPGVEGVSPGGGSRAVCRGTVTYVSVTPGGAGGSCPIPADVRAAFEAAQAEPDRGPAPFVWGADVVRDGRFLQYQPRRRRASELLDDAARWAARDHLVQGDRRLTFADVFAGTAGTADLLRSVGATPGQRVLLLAANSPEWVLTFWGGLQAGATVALGNGWWSEDEVAHALRLLEPAVVVGDERRLAKLPAGTAAVEIDAVRAAAEAAMASPPALAVPSPGGGEEEPALIVFTSGTTGLPKGAVLSHRSVIANLHSLAAVAGRLPHQARDDADPAVILLTGPLFHIGGVQSIGLGLLNGSTLVFLNGRFDPGEVLDLVERENVSMWTGVPTMALRVLDHPSIAGRDLSRVRSISLGGSSVPAELVGRLHHAFPRARKGVSTVYGMTELGGTVAAASGRLMAEHPSTSGRALPVAEIKIDDPGPDGTGEILVRTPGQMSGYWGGAGDAEVFDPDGFVRTGDLGRLVDGLLFVTGRSKDMVIRGGENIAAAHVESALLGHPAVSSVAVVGLPHPDLGEEVGAAVVAASGATVAPADLAAYAAGRLAHFEVPSRWWMHPGPLPTGDTGKLDKKAIKASWPA